MSRGLVESATGAAVAGKGSLESEYCFHYRSCDFQFRDKAIQALLKGSGLIRPGLRVLDAGCGFGMVTFALLNVLRQNNFN